MSDVAAIQALVQKRNELKTRNSKVIVGQNEVIDQILITFFLRTWKFTGYLKTLMVNIISRILV